MIKMKTLIVMFAAVAVTFFLNYNYALTVTYTDTIVQQLLFCHIEYL